MLKKPLIIDESLLVNVVDNDVLMDNEVLGDNADDVIEDVSEDEWLQKSLRLLGRMKKDVVENDNVGQSRRAHYDVLLNNMCEVLNRQLVDGRYKPIIICLEFIREYLMKRIVNVQKVISNSDGPLTPNATRLFKTIVKDAGQLKIGWNGGDLYQANCP
ncbi:hypothetical protein Tco_0699218 [Tanacetum coccineum]